MLARHLVGRDRRERRVGEARDHVEVGPGGLDHQHVGALVEVGERLADALAAVRRIDLVALAIAALRRRVDRAAERAVEGRGVLRAVADQARLDEIGVVERGPDRADAAVHHVGRRDEVGARLGVRHGDAREQLDGRVVVDLAARTEHAARAVVGELAEADVGDDRQLGRALRGSRARRAARRRRRPRRSSPRRPCGRAARTAARRRSLPSATPRASSASRSADRWRWPGKPGIGRSIALALDDEQGLDEVGGIEARLADDPADRLAAAQSPEARGRIGHQWLHRRGAPRAFGTRKVRPVSADARRVASLAGADTTREPRPKSRPAPAPRGERLRRRRCCRGFPGWCSS